MHQETQRQSATAKRAQRTGGTASHVSLDGPVAASFNQVNRDAHQPKPRRQQMQQQQQQPWLQGSDAEIAARNRRLKARNQVASEAARLRVSREQHCHRLIMEESRFQHELFGKVVRRCSAHAMLLWCCSLALRVRHHRWSCRCTIR